MGTVKWIIEWFKANGNNTTEIEQHLEDNYFDMGYIDSFSFIMLIAAIEDKFGITFDNAEFQKREFATIRGLANIVEASK